MVSMVLLITTNQGIMVNTTTPDASARAKRGILRIHFLTQSLLRLVSLVPATRPFVLLLLPSQLRLTRSQRLIR